MDGRQDIPKDRKPDQNRTEFSSCCLKSIILFLFTVKDFVADFMPKGYKTLAE